MANAGSKIGEAYVELQARVEKLEVGLAKAKAEMASYAASAEGSMAAVATASEVSSERVVASSSRATMSLKKQAGAFTSLVGRAFAVVGVFRIFESLGQSIRENWKDGAERAEDFADSLDMTNPIQSLKQTQKEVQQLEAELQQATDSTRGLFSAFRGLRAPASIRRELEETRKLMKSLQDQVNANSRADAAKKQQEDLLKIARDRKQVEEQIARARESFQSRAFGQPFDISQIERAIKTISLSGKLN